MLIDDRTGSKDLLVPLRRLGVKADLSRMEFGDCAFLGQGPGGSLLQVGIEVKTIDDVIQCITSGRFAGHQLPGLLRDYDEVWLVIEGLWRASDTGLLETGKLIPCREPGKELIIWKPSRFGRPWAYGSVLEWLTTMTQARGLDGQRLMIMRTIDRMDTVRFLAAEWHWWCDGPWESHKSLKTFVDYKGRVVNDPKNPRTVGFLRPSLLRRFLKELRGIGWERSTEMEQHFEGDVRAFGRALAAAQEADWLVPHTVGKTGAANIVRAIKENRRD